MLSKNTEDTKKIADAFLKQIKPTVFGATVVGLYGDLGAGKTTFTQAVGDILGVKRKIKSPTFVIIKSYKIKAKSYKLLFHIDAYRLKNEKELLHLGWEEIIANSEHLIFIEWPEQIIKVMPKKHHKILISHTKERHRKFKIN